MKIKSCYESGVGGVSLDVIIDTCHDDIIIQVNADYYIQKQGGIMINKWFKSLKSAHKHYRKIEAVICSEKRKLLNKAAQERAI
jgi:hypothetical protein